MFVYDLFDALIFMSLYNCYIIIDWILKKIKRMLSNLKEFTIVSVSYYEKKIWIYEIRYEISILFFSV